MRVRRRSPVSIDVPDAERRRLLRYGLYVGGLLGLRPWRVFEALEGTAGRALADMACTTTARSVHIVAGKGGFAWFQLLWPHVDVAQAHDGNFAFHAPGEERALSDTDRPMVVAPETPWQQAKVRVSAYVAGANETHTETPTSTTTLGPGAATFAAVTALQRDQPALVPVIAVGNVPYGAAPGAAPLTSVPTADAMVGLFDSAAARDGGTLSNAADARLYEAYYKAFLSLGAAAGEPTRRKSFQTAGVAANLLGRNLSAQLRPSDADFARYGVAGDATANLKALATTLIVTARAFALGLTHSVVCPAMNDDPHGAFGDVAALRKTLATIGRILDAFLGDLMAADDPACSGHKLGDNVVVTIHGDTPKDPLTRSGWPDGTPQASNWVYVLGAGRLKTGWFGGVARDARVTLWDPVTGAEQPAAPGRATELAKSVGAAILYAVSRGDKRRVADFAGATPYQGLVR
jgi:hypothetical protein